MNDAEMDKLLQSDSVGDKVKVMVKKDLPVVSIYGKSQGKPFTLILASGIVDLDNIEKLIDGHWGKPDRDDSIKPENN